METIIIQEEPKSKKKALKNDAKGNGEYKKMYKSVAGSFYKLTKQFSGSIHTEIEDLSYNKKYRD